MKQHPPPKENLLRYVSNISSSVYCTFETYIFTLHDSGKDSLLSDIIRI